MPTETKGGGQQLQVAKRQLVVITCVWKGKENTSHDDFIERFIYLTSLCNFPMAFSVCLSVGQLVGWSVGLSVIISAGSATSMLLSEHLFKIDQTLDLIKLTFCPFNRLSRHWKLGRILPTALFF